MGSEEVMSWILFLITMAAPNEAQMRHIGTYESMDECFTAHEILVENLGRPVINYRPVCLARAVEI